MAVCGANPCVHWQLINAKMSSFEFAFYIRLFLPYDTRIPRGCHKSTLTESLMNQRNSANSIKLLHHIKWLNGKFHFDVRLNHSAGELQYVDDSWNQTREVLNLDALIVIPKQTKKKWEDRERELKRNKKNTSIITENILRGNWPTIMVRSNGIIWYFVTYVWYS